MILNTQASRASELRSGQFSTENKWLLIRKGIFDFKLKKKKKMQRVQCKKMIYAVMGRLGVCITTSCRALFPAPGSGWVCWALSPFTPQCLTKTQRSKWLQWSDGGCTFERRRRTTAELYRGALARLFQQAPLVQRWPRVVRRAQAFGHQPVLLSEQR